MGRGGLLVTREGCLLMVAASVACWAAVAAIVLAVLHVMGVVR